MKGVKLRILNVLYFLISGFSIAWLAITPFADIKVDWNITYDSIKEIVTDDMVKDYGITVKDIFEETDSIPLTAEVKIDNKMLVDVWKAEDSQNYVKDNIIGYNVDAIIDDPTVSSALNKVAKGAAKGMVTDMIEQQLKEQLAAGEDLYTKLGESGLDEEDVKESVGAVIDCLMSEGATIDSVSEKLAEEYNKYFTVLSDDPAKTADDMKDDLEESLGELGLINEDGTIKDISEVIGTLLSGLLGGGNEEDSGKTGAVILKLFGPAAAEEAESLSSVLKKSINEAIAPHMELITWIFKGCGIGIAVFMLGWLIKALQVIIRTFGKKPYIKKEIIGILGGLIQFLLAAVIGLVLLVLTQKELLVSIPVVGEYINVFVLSKIPAGLNVNIGFKTLSVVVPGILVFVNLLISIFYARPKRKFKRAIREGKAG